MQAQLCSVCNKPILLACLPSRAETMCAGPCFLSSAEYAHMRCALTLACGRQRIPDVVMAQEPVVLRSQHACLSNGQHRLPTCEDRATRPELELHGCCTA